MCGKGNGDNIPITNGKVDDDDGKYNDDNLERGKVETEGLSDDPAQDDEEGEHEECDLDAAPDRDGQGQVQLVPHADRDGRDVFGRISLSKPIVMGSFLSGERGGTYDEREQNKRDKFLGDGRGFDQTFEHVCQ